MTANTYGRQVVLPVTNKSGGSLAAGDVVIVDTSNNDAVTTTTSASSVAVIGIVQETIASNATGRVLFGGYAALVNVNASVTRGHYGATHTVAKQAADAGTSRTTGTFCQFLTGGTTPDAVIFPSDLGAGSGLTDPMTTRGDMMVRNASNVTARFAVPASGKFIGGDGTDIIASYPPGTKLNKVEFTSNVNITATTSAGSDVIVTASSVTYDGAAVNVETQATYWECPAGNSLIIVLWDDTAGAALGSLAQFTNPDAINVMRVGGTIQREFTPAAGARVLSIRGFVGVAATGVIGVGAGGAGVRMPGFIRITKV